MYYLRNAFLFVLALIFSSCDQNNQSEFLNETNNSNANNAEELYRANYNKMFGSVVVPSFPKLADMQAPLPVVCVIGDDKGKIKFVRRPLPDGEPWAFEEVSINSSGLIDLPSKKYTVLLVVDKHLSAKMFAELLINTEKMFGTTQIWLQVWGIHPFPLQIPINLKFRQIIERAESDKTLQDVVNDIHDMSASPN